MRKLIDEKGDCRLMKGLMIDICTYGQTMLIVKSLSRLKIKISNIRNETFIWEQQVIHLVLNWTLIMFNEFS